MATKIALLSEADASKVKQSHVAFLPKGVWRFISERVVQSKISICYESPNGLKNQKAILLTYSEQAEETVLICDVGTKVFLVIEEPVAEKLTIFAEKIQNASSPSEFKG